MRRRYILDSVVTPKPARATERRYPALGTHPGSGKNEDSVIGRDGEHGSSVPSSGSDSFVRGKQVVTAWSQARQTRLSVHVICQKSLVTRPESPANFQTPAVYREWGEAVTIQELMQEQRRRVCSRNQAERFAAALLIPAELSRRLRLLSDSQLGQLLDEEVCANMNILVPEATICLVAADRLRSPSRCNNHRE